MDMPRTYKTNASQIYMYITNCIYIHMCIWDLHSHSRSVAAWGLWTCGLLACVASAVCRRLISAGIWIPVARAPEIAAVDKPNFQPMSTTRRTASPKIDRSLSPPRKCQTRQSRQSRQIVAPLTTTTWSLFALSMSNARLGASGSSSTAINKGATWQAAH